MITPPRYDLSLVLPWATADIQRKIQGLAIASPNEICGAVVMDDDEAVVVEFANIAKDPTEHFSVSQDEIDGVERDRILAVYHSHPGSGHANLSYYDIQDAQRQNLPVLMFHPESFLWDYYDPRASHPYPLEMREVDPKHLEHYLLIPFEWGRSDCSTLVAHYYRGMLDVQLKQPHPPRGRRVEEVYTDGWDKCRRSLALNGWQQIPEMASLKLHDVICINEDHPNDPNRTTPSHLAILVDEENGLLLHHPGDRRSQTLSRLEAYTPLLQAQTNSIWRYPLP